jgi:hypothetical protein
VKRSVPAHISGINGGLKKNQLSGVHSYILFRRNSPYYYFL